MLIVDKSIVGPWIARKTQMIWKPEGSQTIGWMRDGEVVAGVWYDDWNGISVVTHIAIDGPITSEYLATIYDYPFNQLQVEKIIAPVLEDNAESIKLVTKMGFEVEARLKNVHPSGDMLFFVMHKNKCKYLGNRYGKKLAISTAST